MRNFVGYPYRARLDEIKKKRVKKGQVLFRSKPFCYILEYGCQAQFCENCLVNIKDHSLPLTCKCGRTRYCSENCRQVGQVIHFRECQVFQRRPNFKPKNLTMFMARIIWKLNAGGYEISEKIDEKRSRRFRDLESHIPDIKKDPSRREILINLRHELRQLVGPNMLPSNPELVAIYGRVCINMFALLDDQFDSIGLALYLAPSIMDHSCCPNAFVSFQGKQIVVRSLVDHDNFNWNKVRITYIDQLNLNSSRREQLLKNYYFLCDCPFCKDDHRARMQSSINCGNPACENGIFIDLDVDDDQPLEPCHQCGFSDLSADVRSTYRGVITFTKDTLNGMSESDPCPDMVSDILDMQGELLHPLNAWRAKTLDAFLTAALARSCWTVALRTMRQNQEAVKWYYGSDHPNYGLFLVRMGRAELFMTEHKAAVDHLYMAQDILEVGVGSAHPAMHAEASNLLIRASGEMVADMKRADFKFHLQRDKDMKNKLGSSKTEGTVPEFG
ncbi:unnamed protein product [Meganyctiphanes norvegica]|uniref:Uncharacterized protein n=1 Tax=Meganyctiphanes norvegica TaxID=48144 RepID=A0AAV2QT81_MEGNR